MSEDIRAAAMPTQPPENAELAACPNPWCEAHERDGDYSPVVRLHHYGNYRVVCTSCVFEGPLRATEAEAITAWNTRPSLSSPVLPGVREAIEKAIKFSDNYFAPWGSWKTAWWEGEVSDDAAFCGDNALKHVINILRALPSETPNHG